jgi:hypothetical protein
MIAIINLGTNPKPHGTHEYVIRINHHEICKFKHRRENGLAVCLKKASEAVENMDIDRMLEDLHEK